MAAPEPQTLPAALFRHAALRPDEPWLFVREGWDWRWSSFAEAAGRIAGWAAGLPPDISIAFPDLSLPRAIALDLAIQAAGSIAVPLPGELSGEALSEALVRSGAGAWLGGLEPGAPPPGIGALELSDATPGLVAPPSREAGGVRVAVPGGEVEELSQAHLLAAARAIQAALPPPPAGCQRREIAVLAPPLAAPPTRRVLAWATYAGAALVLEPDPAALAATAAWARPTVFLGDASAIAALRRALPAESRIARLVHRRPRLPFGRLHSLLVAGSALAPEDAGFWTARGVRVVEEPALRGLMV